MARIEINEEVRRTLLIDPNGPVMRNMLERGHRVLAEALTKVPSHTGDLAVSLNVAVVPEGGQTVVRVGSDDERALWVHEGTGPAHIESDGGLGFRSSPNPTYFPPYSNAGVHDWAMDKNLVPYAVALHISVFGTPAFNFLRSSLHAAR